MVWGVWEFAEFASALTGPVNHFFWEVRKMDFLELSRTKETPQTPKLPSIACADLAATTPSARDLAGKTGEDYEHDNTIKMTPAEMADYNRGVNAFLEGELIGCPPDATAAFEFGWKRMAASWREYEIEECNRHGWGWGGSLRRCMARGWRSVNWALPSPSHGQPSVGCMLCSTRCRAREWRRRSILIAAVAGGASQKSLGGGVADRGFIVRS